MFNFHDNTGELVGIIMGLQRQLQFLKDIVVIQSMLIAVLVIGIWALSREKKGGV